MGEDDQLKYMVIDDTNNDLDLDEIPPLEEILDSESLERLNRAMAAGGGDDV